MIVGYIEDIPLYLEESQHRIWTATIHTSRQDFRADDESPVAAAITALMQLHEVARQQEYTIVIDPASCWAVYIPVELYKKITASTHLTHHNPYMRPFEELIEQGKRIARERAGSRGIIH